MIDSLVLCLVQVATMYLVYRAGFIDGERSAAELTLNWIKTAPRQVLERLSTWHTPVQLNWHLQQLQGSERKR